MDLNNVNCIVTLHICCLFGMISFLFYLLFTRTKTNKQFLIDRFINCQGPNKNVNILTIHKKKVSNVKKAFLTDFNPLSKTVPIALCLVRSVAILLLGHVSQGSNTITALSALRKKRQKNTKSPPFPNFRHF